MSASVLRRACNASDDTLKQCITVLAPLLSRAAVSSSRDDRLSALILSSRLCTLDGTALPTELTCAIAFGLARTNRSFFGRYVDAQPDDVRGHLLQRLQLELSSESLGLADVANLAALCASLACAPSLATAMGRDREFMLSLCRLYDIRLPRLVTVGTQWQTSLTAESRAFLQSRLDLLEAVHGALEAAFLQDGPTAQVQEDLVGLLWEMLDLPSVAVECTPPTSLVSLGILGDLEAFYTLSSRIECYERTDDVAYIIATLKRLVPDDFLPGLPLLAANGSASHSSSTHHGVPTNLLRADREGKGRALNKLDDLQVALPGTDEASLPTPFEQSSAVRASHSAEAATSATPGDRSTSTSQMSSSSVTQAPATIGTTRSALADVRANVFEDRLDISKATKGKKRPEVDFDSDLGRRIDEELRASILAFAEDDAERQKQIEREIELDEWDPETAHLPVSRAAFETADTPDGDVGAEAEADDDMPDEADVSPTLSARQLPDPDRKGLPGHVTRILERAYLSDPLLFEANEKARKSAVRKVLRDQTGLADDLIESWGLMLSRNPNKERILARHATDFEGNERGLYVPSGYRSQRDGQSRARGRATASGRGRGSSRGQASRRSAGRARRAGKPG